MFPAELVALYPDAKAMLTVRDEAKWEKSMLEMLKAMPFWPVLVLRFLVDPLKG